jgi:hypothetical protein
MHRIHLQQVLPSAPQQQADLELPEHLVLRPQRLARLPQPQLQERSARPLLGRLGAVSGVRL